MCTHACALTCIVYMKTRPNLSDRNLERANTPNPKWWTPVENYRDHTVAVLISICSLVVYVQCTPRCAFRKAGPCNTRWASASEMVDTNFVYIFPINCIYSTLHWRTRKSSSILCARLARWLFSMTHETHWNHESKKKKNDSTRKQTRDEKKTHKKSVWRWNCGDTLYVVYDCTIWEWHIIISTSHQIITTNTHSLTHTRTRECTIDRNLKHPNLNCLAARYMWTQNTCAGLINRHTHKYNRTRIHMPMHTYACVCVYGRCMFVYIRETLKALYTIAITFLYFRWLVCTVLSVFPHCYWCIAVVCLLRFEFLL